MTSPRIGEPAPEIELPATGDRVIRLSELRGRPVVLYFYPRDNTPGCTAEAKQFRDLATEFNSADAVVLGVSRDGVGSHEKFRDKHGLGFALLADTDETACSAYDVIRGKNLYGKRVRGIERSTFLIDIDGLLRQEWRGVKVPGHAEEVLQAVTTL